MANTIFIGFLFRFKKVVSVTCNVFTFFVYSKESKSQTEKTKNRNTCRNNKRKHVFNTLLECQRVTTINKALKVRDILFGKNRSFDDNFVLI